MWAKRPYMAIDSYKMESRDGYANLRTKKYE
jgi:hypothetical protein